MSANRPSAAGLSCGALVVLLAGCVSSEEPRSEPAAGVPAAGDKLSGTVWIRYEASSAQEICWAAALTELPSYSGPSSCDVTLPIDDVVSDSIEPPQGRQPYALADVRGTYRSDGQLDDVEVSSPQESPAEGEPLAGACDDTGSGWVERVADDVTQSAVLAELERRADLVTRYEFPLLTEESSVIVVSSVLDPAEVRARLETLWPNLCVLPARWDRAAMLEISQPLQDEADRLHWNVRQDFDGGVTVSMLVLTEEQQSILDGLPRDQVRVEPDLVSTDR